MERRKVICLVYGDDPLLKPESLNLLLEQGIKAVVVVDIQKPQNTLVQDLLQESSIPYIPTYIDRSPEYPTTRAQRRAEKRKTSKLKSKHK